MFIVSKEDRYFTLCVCLFSICLSFCFLLRPLCLVSSFPNYFKLISSVGVVFSLSLLPDPCENAGCNHYAKCVSQSDGSARCICPQCSLNYKPVCGSDGSSYPSRCLLEKHSCASQKTITVSGVGRCSKFLQTLLTLHT